MTFEPSKNYVGLQPTIEEVDYEVIPRKKCKRCKCYLSKGTVSIFCLRCSVKINSAATINFCTGLIETN